LSSSEGWLPGNFSIAPNTLKLLRKYGLSQLILCNIWTKAGYWAKMGNQRLMHYEDNEDLRSFGENASLYYQELI
jgi:hypothetical protein